MSLGLGSSWNTKVKTEWSSTNNTPKHFSTEKGPPLWEHIEHIWISPARIIKDFGGEESKGGDDPSFVFPLLGPLCGPLLSSTFAPSNLFPIPWPALFQIPAHPFSTHWWSTYITRNARHWRKNTLALLLFPFVKGILPLCCEGLRDGGVLQRSGKALSDSLEPLSWSIMVHQGSTERSTRTEQQFNKPSPLCS